MSRTKVDHELKVLLFRNALIVNCYVISKMRRWCNGIMRDSHSCDPGSIPGRRTVPFLQPQIRLLAGIQIFEF